MEWVLRQLPHESYLGVSFDRIDNDGHYEPGNLRLASQRVQRCNASNVAWVQYRDLRVPAFHLWHLLKRDNPAFASSPERVRHQVRKGLSWEEILYRSKPPSVQVRRRQVPTKLTRRIPRYVPVKVVRCTEPDPAILALY